MGRAVAPAGGEGRDDDGRRRPQAVQHLRHVTARQAGRVGRAGEQQACAAGRYGLGDVDTVTAVAVFGGLLLQDGGRLARQRVHTEPVSAPAGSITNP